MQELVATFALSFSLVFLAEIGDKSQLVCMALAARHRGLPVFCGAVAAFALLNILAVAFGATLAHWIPPHWIAVAVAVLFAFFGVRALLENGDEALDETPKTARSLFLSSFSLIFLAEFGDKTQLAVAGLATQQSAVAVWLGGTLALGLTSALGVFAGRKLLTRMPIHLLHRISGVFFLVMAAASLAGLWW